MTAPDPMSDCAVFVINLDGSTGRMDALAPLLDAADLDWTRLSAVDGRNGPVPGWERYNEARTIIRHDRPMRGGEMGCFLSHLKALDAFVATGKPFAIVLEDDVIIPPNFKASAQKVIATLEDYAGDTWETVHLMMDTRGYFRPAVEVPGVTTIQHSYFIPCGTPAILWSRRGAQNFLASRYAQEISGMVDRELRSYAARAGHSYHLDPWICDRHDGDSDIDDGADRWAGMANGGRTTLRCKVRRHFPDYLHATISKALRRK